MDYDLNVEDRRASIYDVGPKLDELMDKLYEEAITMRQFLKVKVKTLTAEAQIIRHEERIALRDDTGAYRALHEHRVHVVRKAARSTHLAYGFLRGRAHEEMECKRRTEPNWPEVARMVRKYGGSGSGFAELSHLPDPLRAELKRKHNLR